MGRANTGQVFEASAHLIADLHVGGATLRGQGHIDGDVLLVFGDWFEAHVVDQAQIHDVNRNLGIVALL